MTTFEIRIAELHPDQVASYERLHREIPLENLLGLLAGGYRRVRIHRSGLRLVMVSERDATAERPPNAAVRAASLEWERLTAPLFAQPWSQTVEIFDFDAASMAQSDATSAP